jgi:hypothetical protein
MEQLQSLLDYFRDTLLTIGTGVYRPSSKPITSPMVESSNEDIVTGSPSISINAIETPSMEQDLGNIDVDNLDFDFDVLDEYEDID